MLQFASTPFLHYLLQEMYVLLYIIFIEDNLCTFYSRRFRSIFILYFNFIQWYLIDIIIINNEICREYSREQ